MAGGYSSDRALRNGELAEGDGRGGTAGSRPGHSPDSGCVLASPGNTAAGGVLSGPPAGALAYLSPDSPSGRLPGSDPGFPPSARPHTAPGQVGILRDRCFCAKADGPGIRAISPVTWLPLLFNPSCAPGMQVDFSLIRSRFPKSPHERGKAVRSREGR